MSFASPPCFAHELVETAEGLEAADPQTARDVIRWRRAERLRLIEVRRALPASERRGLAIEVACELDRLVEASAPQAVGVYWPFRGELDLTAWMRALDGRGICVALPVVVAKHQPLAFRAWWPGCRLERGVWNIPIPAEGPTVVPELLVVPLVGFDDGCYRLGYGGGFYDRTLAALRPRPTAVGVGHPSAAVPTIFPQPHDVPMDAIVTGAGRVRCRSGG